MALPENWLSETRELQKSAFGVDPAALAGAERAEYVRTQVLAAVAELVEALDEWNWKPWSRDALGEVDTEKFVAECVDVGHFVANALVAAGATDEQYWAAYAAKAQRNRDRMANGYRSRGSKCPSCGRELDAPGAYRVVTEYVRPPARPGQDVTLVGPKQTHDLACNGCGTVFPHTVPDGGKLP